MRHRRPVYLRRRLCGGFTPGKAAVVNDTGRALWVVVQEGGTSQELYVWTGDSEDDAAAFRSSCEAAAYRTTDPFRLSDTGLEWGDVQTVLDSLSSLGFPSESG